MKTLIALLLLASSAFAQDFDWGFTDEFSWGFTEKGGDSESTPSPSAEEAQDAPIADPAGTASETATAGSVSLRQAIASYRASGGPRYYVRGKSDAAHLVEDHGWTYEAIRGLNYDDLQFLHGASHTGRIDPNQFVAANRNAAPFNPAGVSGDAPAGAADIRGSDKPALTIRVAPFHCPPCNQVKRMDWSGFYVTWETGGHVERGYPEISWRDSRGTKRWKAGAYTPEQIRWSMERTP